MTISSAIVSGITKPDQSNIVDLQGFLRILTDQLNNQDPLKPVDNQQFVAQLAQFAALDQSRQLNEKMVALNENMAALLVQQGTNQTIGLLGKTVETVNEKSGKVTAITFQNGVPLLTLQPSTGGFIPNVKFSDIVTIL